MTAPSQGSLDGERIASPPEAARGGIDPHHARGRGRVAQSGDALFDRQGFERDAACGDEGVLSGQAAVPAAACRHDLEVPRDDRLPRRDGEAARPRPDRPYQPGRRDARHLADRLGLAGAHPGDEDRGAEAGARQVRLRRGFRRRAARRGEEPRQGTHLLASAPPRTPGIRAISARSSGASTTPASARANRSASSRCPTGPSSTSGNISGRRTFPSCRSISPRSGRWSSARAR